MKIKQLVSALTLSAGALAAMALPSIASAVEFKLDTSAAASGLGSATSSTIGSGNFGSVFVTANSTGGVDVDVKLYGNYYFANTGNKHEQFVFNLANPNTAAVTFTGDSATTPSTWTATKGGAIQTPWGTFNNDINFTTYTTPAISPYKELTFSIAGITLNSFTASSATNNGQPGGYFFSADIGCKNSATDTSCATNNATGNVVGTKGEDPRRPKSIPEPSTIALLGLGLLGAAFAGRRKLK